MNQVVIKVCTDMVNKLQDLEKKAQHDIVYYKGAREAVILVASEVQRLTQEAEQSGRQQQQPAAEGTGSGKPKSSLSEIRSQRAKRQKADHPAE